MMRFWAALVLVCVNVIAQAAPEEVNTDFRTLQVLNRSVDTFVYEYQGRIFIPQPIFNSLGLRSVPEYKQIPVCGRCVTLDSFAEVDDSGGVIILFPYSEYQDKEGKLGVSTRREIPEIATPTQYASWLDYRLSQRADTFNASTDLYVSSPYGTFITRGSYDKDNGYDNGSSQFVVEDVIGGTEVIFGDMNVTSIQWGETAQLVGAGIFSTDPYLRINDYLYQQIEVPVETTTQLVINRNGDQIFEGQQGVGTFLIEDIYGSGLVELEVKKNEETDSLYRFYFSPQSVPKGWQAVDGAVGKFTQGRFANLFGAALRFQFGLTDNLWVQGTAMTTSNAYIAGSTVGITTVYGELRASYSQSDQGFSYASEYSYRTIDSFFSISHIEDRRFLGLNGMRDRRVSRATYSHRLGPVNMTLDARKERDGEFYRIGLNYQRSGFSMSAGVEYNEEKEYQYDIRMRYRFGNSVVNSFASKRSTRVGYTYDKRTDTYDTRINIEQDVSNGSLRGDGTYTSRYGSASVQYVEGRDPNYSYVGSVATDFKSVALGERIGGVLAYVSEAPIAINVSGVSGINVIDKGNSGIIALTRYMNRDVRLDARDFGKRLGRNKETLVTGRYGAYAIVPQLASPGIQLKIEDKSVTHVVLDDMSYEVFPRIGAFIEKASVGLQTVTLMAGDKVRCQVQLEGKDEFSVVPVSCG